MDSGTIVSVSGPLVVAKGLDNAKIRDICYVGDANLVGEIIQIRNENVYVQVYEETSMVGPGEPVKPTGKPLYPIERILFEGLTMHAPTCVPGSFERMAESAATPIKYSSQLI